jgi:hypothetical protein
METDDDEDESQGWTGGTFWLAGLIIACLIVAGWLFGEQFCRWLLGLPSR